MPTRILIVDDSPLVRQLLRDGLSSFPDLQIVGEAGDGLRAERLVQELAPDVITMDVVMPMMGGLEAIRSIMARRPTPIVVVADPHKGLDTLAMQAMAAGAIDVFPKAADFGGRLRELVALLRHAAQVRMRPARRKTTLPIEDPAVPAALRTAACIGIVTSAGGPHTLNALLRGLPATFPVPIAIVQHTARGFGIEFANWLDHQLHLAVSEAAAGDRLAPGRILVAPDDMAMEISAHGIVRLAPSPSTGDVALPGSALLGSLARAFGPRAAGIVLTGMGSDGADGLQLLEARGGLAIVQDPGDAMIDGMPSRAIERTRMPVVARVADLADLLARAARPPA